MNSSDNITNDNSPTITGNAEANSTVQLSQNGEVVGEVVATDGGNWEITTNNLTDGSNNFSAIAIDEAGNISTDSTPLTILVDTALPSINLTTGTDTPLREGDKLTGIADGTGSDLENLTYSFDDGEEFTLNVDSEGNFDQEFDLTGLDNGSHILNITSIDTAGNVNTIQYNVTVNIDDIAPIIAAGLFRDTAPNNQTNTDNITFDATISGTVTEENQIVELKAAFDNISIESGIDVTSQLQPDGSFTFNQTTLETIYGDSLPDGTHTLRLQAKDEYGNVSNNFDITFTLDTNIVQPVFDLNTESDSDEIGDKKTTFEIITLIGQTESNATVSLQGTDLNTTADSEGNYSFADISLELGDNSFTAISTDIAGNQNTYTEIITRLNPPAGITLDTNTIPENSNQGTVIGILGSTDTNTENIFTYSLINDAEGRFQIVDNQLTVADGTLLDFETTTQHNITVRSVDNNGAVATEEFSIDVTNVNEAPLFNSTPEYTGETGSEYIYNINTTDPDAGDNRTISSSNLPEWLTLTDNGDGSATLSGTPTNTADGIPTEDSLYNVDLTVTDAGGLTEIQSFIISAAPNISLTEETNFTQNQNISFTIPQNPSILKFKINPQFDTTDAEFINDAFEIALINENGESLVHTFSKDKDAFFNLTEGENAALGAGTNYNSADGTVSLNLNGIAPETDAKLIFRLVNNDSDTTTNVTISDFTVEIAPQGTEIPTQNQFDAELTPGETPDFNLLTDVSDSFSAEYKRTTYNADTKLLYADIAIRNNGSYSVDAPLIVAVTNISDPSVILRNPEGLTPEGIPYYNFSNLVENEKLNPEELTSNSSLVFYNPEGGQFTYNLQVLAEINAAPIIDSEPELEILGGKQYQYQVEATDPNDDTISYELLTSPEGMSIDAETGLITWETTTDNIGNQNVVVQVSDSRGRTDTQVFNLAVIDTPPNRPPVFTSTPVVDAAINTEYKYDVNAKDPDFDEVNYNLGLAPEGMEIDASTGEITWTPPAVLNLGDTILGRISIPGEKDEFSFSGTVGQRIYFDPLQYSGSYRDWNFNIVSPSGKKTINIDFRYNKIITLEETGNYRITVDTDDDKTGSYGFSVIDLNMIPQITYDTEIKGSLNPGSEDDLFSFTGNKGQKLFFDRITKSGTMNWALYDTQNKEIASNSSFNDIEFYLPEDGEYILALRGGSAFTSTIDYSFEIITPDEITTPITLGNNTNPNSIYGEITEKGEEDFYTFTGTPGQRIYFDRLFLDSTSSSALDAKIYSPSGRQVFSRNFRYGSDLAPITLDESGTYRVRINASGEETGTYSFNILDLGNSIPIDLDINYTGTLEPGQETHFYNFTGNDGQRLYLDTSGGIGTSNTNWTLYDSNNKSVGSSSLNNDIEVLLTKTDNYTLAIRGNNGNDPVNYSFEVITPDTNSETLTLDTTVTNTITEKGERDVYTFTGSKSQRLFLDTLISTPDTRATLVSPSGSKVINNAQMYRDYNRHPVILPEAGDYELIIDGSGESTDEYSFRLVDLTNATILPRETPTSGTLNPGTSIQFYQFDGNEGERIYFDNQVSSPNTNWHLYNSNNNELAEVALSNDFEYVLPGDSTYYLMLRGENGTTVDYNIQIVGTTSSDISYVLDTLVNTDISKLGEQDTYIFNGTVGQTIYFDPSVGNTNITAKIHSPSGVEIFDGNTSKDGVSIRLLEEGSYRLTFDGSSDTTGNYSFRVADLESQDVLPTDTPLNGTLTVGETKLYQISGTKGDVLEFDSLASVSGAEWVLYAPSGKDEVGKASLDTDFTRTLASDGVYTLAVRNTSDSAVTYDLQVNDVTPTAVTNNGLGVLHEGEISVGGEVDEYTFTANAGTFVYYDGQGDDSSARVRLYNPDNTLFFSNYYTNRNTGSLLLQQTGTYKLEAYGYNSNVTGNYKFQLLDLEAAPVLSLNTNTDVSLDAKEVKAYKFTGIVGQKVWFDGLNSSNPNITAYLYNSNGRQLYSHSDLRNDVETQTLSQDGTYYLVLSSNSTSDETASFRLLDDIGATNVDLDTDITGNFGTSQREANIYKFSGSEGQRLYFDRNDGDYDNYYSVYNKNGERIFFQRLSSDAEPTELPYDGEYTLIFEGRAKPNNNSDTGEIIWLPEGDVIADSKVDFEVEVSDRRGGKDVQIFSVDVYEKLGKIQGAVFEDLNSNAFRDTKLVKGTSPNIVFAIDVSGSAGGRTVDWTTTDLNTFANGSYSILDMELATAIALSEQLVLQGRGDSAKIGVVLWGSDASLLDMNPSEPGVQLYTTALADNNNNGIVDIKEVLNINSPGGGTNFTPGLVAAKGTLDSLSGDANLIFMSDGFGNVDETIVSDIREAGVNITAFGIGRGSSMGQLLKVDPDAIQLTDVSELVNIFSGWDSRYAEEPFLEDITVYLDLNNNGQLDKDEPKQLTKRDNSDSLLENINYYYSFSNLLPGTYNVRQIVPNGYTQTAPENGSFVDTVTVNGGETFSHLFGLNKVEPVPNVDPVFSEPAANLTVTSGEKLIYSPLTIDPDANALTYDLPLAPSGMVVDKETGTLVWTPQDNQSGTFNVILRVQDGEGGNALQAFDVTVLPKNNAPIFTSSVPENAIPQVGKTWNYQVSAQDADGDVLTYSLTPDAPTDVTINSGTGLVQWTPQQQGEQEFRIKVTDSKGESALQVVSLVVSEALPNSAPVITSTPRDNVRSGNTYLYQIQANDVDGDALTYTLDNAPDGMTLEDDNVIVWTPGANQFGEQEVVLSVSDGEATVTQSFNVNVTNQSINNAPTITSVPELITNIEKEYTYNVTGTDADGDYLVWSLDNAPNGMVINPETGALRWNPTEEQIGEHTVAVRLTDANGAFVGQEFTLYVNGTNTPPQIVSTAITRAAVNQDYSYQIVATDPENDNLTYSLGNSPAGMSVSENGLITWIPEENQLDDVNVSVFVTDAQGATSNQSFTIEIATQEVNGEVVPVAINNAPEIISNPVYLAELGGTYEYQVVANDSDVGDTLTYQLLSVPDNLTGMSIDATTGLLTWNNPVAGTYQIAVGAVDSQGLGAAQGFTLTARANNAPVINSIPGNIVNAGSIYSYDIRAVDVDGDVLSYTLDQASLDKGISIDELGRLRWKTTVGDTNHSAIVTVADGNGGSTQQEVEINVVGDTEAPQVRLIAGFNFINQGENVTFQARATDNVGVAGLQLLINDNPVVIDANGLFTVENAVAGTLRGVAIATDAAGNTSEATFDVDVVDTSDVNAPTVSFSLDVEEDGIVTAPTDIIGTISDDGDIDYYTVEVAPVAGGEFKEILRVDNPDAVTDGVLGKFDPSLLQNDSYRVRLSVYDTGGNGTFAEEVVDVAGELKLGNFRLSFTDLEVPVTGIPITLTRTYDTLTSNTTDEFGYGWRMEFRDADLRTSLGRDEQYEDFGIRSQAFDDNTKVYITLPGGNRQAFEFEPIGDPINRYIYGAESAKFYNPGFKAIGDTESTLSLKLKASDELENGPLNRTTRINRQQDGTYRGNFSPYNPADPYFGVEYVLTTKEGIAYIIDPTTGKINEVRDTNDNRLYFTDEAVTSSTGKKVTFERDAEGRITSVKDPEGELIRYEYDDNGDLVSVTDREKNVTRMEYSPEREHYLDKIIDPLGREGVRNEYDPVTGRLNKIIDANGNPIELDYNPDNLIQTVKDALGNPTTYEYDERGNVVQEIDAVGKITKREYYDDSNELKTETIITDESGSDGYTTTYTYDERGNQTSRTNPLGNTDRYTYNEFDKLLTSTDALGNTTSYTFDSRGNVLSKTDAVGNVVEYTYDNFGNPLSILEGENDITYFEYDSRGNRIKETDALGNVTTYTYDNKGNFLSETMTLTNPEGVRTLVTTTTYDSNNNVTSILDAEGNLTQYEYDANGNQTVIIDPLGRRSINRYDEKNNLIETIFPDDTPDDLSDNLRMSVEYDSAGNRTSTTDFTGNSTYYSYDPINRPTELIVSDNTPSDLTDNPRMLVEYNQAGQMSASIDEFGNRTEYEYDAVGRIILTRQFIDGQAVETTTTYDAAGEVIASTDALGRTTRYVYDALGQVIEIIFHDGTSITTEYDAFGNEIAKTDQAGNTTYYKYDVLDRLIAVEDTLGHRTEYQYDEADNLVYQKDANDNVTRFEFDGLGRQTATVRPLGQKSSTLYDKVGNVISTTDFNGEILLYEYNELNLVTAKRFEDSTSVEFDYDDAGRLEAVTDERGTTSFTYNKLGNLLSRTEADGKTISYTYNDAGQIENIITPSETISYTYDAFNHLDKVTANGEVTDYDYDTVGNLVQTTLPNNVVETRSYDDLNRLIGVVNTDADGNVISGYDYTLDAVGNRILVEELSGRTVSYEYDKLYRLIGEDITDSVNGNRTLNYTFDAVGNRLTLTDSINGVTTYNYSDNDWLLSETTAGVSTTYSYDDNGNTISKINPSEQIIYNWNQDNRLIGAEITNNVGTSNLEYQYDAFGNRVASIVDEIETRYLVDTNWEYAQVLEEYTTDGTTEVSYIHGLSLIKANRGAEESFYLYDGHSGVRQLTDESGVVTDTYNYDAYGNLLNSTGSTQNNYLYRGEQYDQDLGMQYLRARYYEPQTGRFASVDPFEGVLEMPMSRHRYSYGNANPITYIDPSGEFALLGDFTASGVIQDILLATAITGITLSAGNILSNAITNTASRFRGKNVYNWEGGLALTAIGAPNVLGLFAFGSGGAGITPIFYGNLNLGMARLESTWFGGEKVEGFWTIGYGTYGAGFYANATINEVVVTSRGRAPFPNADDLTGLFVSLGAGASISIPGIFERSTRDLSRFIMNISYGKNKEGGFSAGFEAGAGLMTGWSQNVWSIRNDGNETPS